MVRLIKDGETIISVYVPHSDYITIDCVPLFGKVGEYDRVNVGDLVESHRTDKRDDNPISGIVVKITEKLVFFRDDDNVVHNRKFKNVRLLDWEGIREEQPQ